MRNVMSFLLLFLLSPLALSQQTPVADAGADRIETLGARVVLNGGPVESEGSL